MTILEAEQVRMPFGLHKDRTLGQVAAADVSYFDYLLSIDGVDSYLVAAVAVVARKHGRARKVGAAASKGQGVLFS